MMHADLEKLNGLAPRACELCRRKDGIRRCSACQSVYYCGRDCQTKDRDDHKTSCKMIKRARLCYELEENKLRNTPGNLDTENVFEDHAGHFWGLVETRPYMRARYELVDVLLLGYGFPGGSVDVVQTALDHLLDMIWLCRTDNLGLRQLVPALYIRLGRDQDAYDFMKFCATTLTGPQYDVTDTSQPFLDVRGADVLEAPEELWISTEFQDMSHAVAVALIKMRALLDLQAIRNTRIALRGAIPQEIVEMICGHVTSYFFKSRHDIILAKPEEMTQLARTLQSQIRELYVAVEEYNLHFWEFLFTDPDASVLQKIYENESYSPRSKAEALLVLGASNASWYETPGALDTLARMGLWKTK